MTGLCCADERLSDSSMSIISHSIVVSAPLEEETFTDEESW